MKGFPLKQLFVNGTKLKWAILAFFILQSLWTYIGANKFIYLFPFYMYGMYSTFCENQQTYENWEIEINGEKVDFTRLNYWEKEMILNNVSYYNTLLNKNTHDPLELIVKTGARMPLFIQPYFYKNLLNNDTDIRKFPLWLKSYLESIYGKKIKHLELNLTYNIYLNGHVQCMGMKRLFEL